jgi:hypothetical protein
MLLHVDLLKVRRLEPWTSPLMVRWNYFLAILCLLVTYFFVLTGRSPRSRGH